MAIERPKSDFPLPEDAQKVFEGAMFNVYQWQQKLFDGSFATFEKLEREDTVVLIPVTKDGSILIVNEEQPNTKPKIKVPTGRVHRGEEIASAAARELLEETGYEAEGFDLWQAVQPSNKIEWAIYFLVARNCQKVADQDLDGGEKIEVSEVSWEGFVDLAASEEFREIFITEEVLRSKLDPVRMENLRKLVLG